MRKRLETEVYDMRFKFVLGLIAAEHNGPSNVRRIAALVETLPSALV